MIFLMGDTVTVATPGGGTGIQLQVNLSTNDDKATPALRLLAAAVRPLVWEKQEGLPLKPDPTLAKALIKSLDAIPAAYVGDSQVDIALGKNLGVPTILMTWGSRSAEELRRTDPKAVLADNAAALEALLTERLSWLQEEWGDEI